MQPVKLIVYAGPHARRHAPLRVDLGATAAGGRLVRATDGVALPCQVSEGTLHFVLDRLAAGATCELAYEPGPAATGVTFEPDEAAGAVAIGVDGRAFTTYRYANVAHRPYLHPLLGPHGVPLTRAFPMVEGVAGETTDHKHHRSLWVAHGDLNGSDNWAEEADSGFQAHRNVLDCASGPAWGLFRHALTWQDERRAPVLDEVRTLRVHRTPEAARLVDLTATFTAAHGRVAFGDTKEGGICSVRVATSMDGNKGGRIENSAGGIGEAETWGKPAHWCDYSGPCDGQHAGIAIFDHPLNLRHPTPWHVRDYGLMTANPFGHGAFKSSLLRDGTYGLDAGRSLTFRYRIYIHEEDAAAANVRDRYHDWVHPPKVDVAGSPA